MPSKISFDQISKVRNNDEKRNLTLDIFDNSRKTKYVIHE